ncbi:MAG: hypothetical protein QF704_15565 [Anaerolineales bacterium]|nr:hypothetical protein [Anaerolineales bacterium]
MINIYPNKDVNVLVEIEDTNQTKTGDLLSCSNNGSGVNAEVYLYVVGQTGSHGAHVVHLETQQNGVWQSLGSVTGEGSLRHVGTVNDLRYNIVTSENSVSTSLINIGAIKS